jgi:hypothetical protein
MAKNAQHSVHPTGGSLRVFRQFVWLGVGSGKVASSRPTHPRVTLTVRHFFHAVLKQFYTNSRMIIGAWLSRA